MTAEIGSRLLAIDPGPARSGWALLGPGGRVLSFGIDPNPQVLEMLASPAWGRVAIELIEPRFGVQLGWATIDACRWVGRLEQAALPVRAELIARSSVLRFLGVVTSPRKGERRVSADAGARQALIARHGGTERAAFGLRASPGPLHGMTSHALAALAVGLAALGDPTLARQEEPDAR